ncbi:M50 family metallopeptidase [Pseudactinotalea suaedae]|uniref:M50 family metallopeptidase n=1 Tax=Pseudactinotalea suaedae TaxID=1524924 RepID=UPI0012E14B94
MFWIGVLAVAVGLIVSIALHEIGHLLPAKKFGVRVPQYFVGFGPTIWSRRRGETEYGVKAIPLGGFVRMIGMFPPARTDQSPESATEDRIRRRGLVGWAKNVADDAREVSLEEIGPGDEKRAFYQLSTPKKLAVMFGGPVVNLILSALLFTIVVSGIGFPVATNAVDSVAACVQTTGDGECEADAAPAPSVDAGFEAGDVIVSWGGTPVEDWTDVSAAIREGGAEPTEVVVERDGTPTTLTVTPTLVEREVTGEDGSTTVQEVPYVGIVSAVVREPQPLTEVPGVVGQQLSATVGVVLTLPQRLASIAQAVFGIGERDPNVIGVIGIGRVAGDLNEANAEDGFTAQLFWLLTILASLNMALFVFNMIPLPPLDGGHIAGALFEGGRRQVARWRGRPNPGYADTAKLMPLTYAVFILFVGMGLLLAVADIVEPVVLT